MDNSTLLKKLVNHGAVGSLSLKEGPAVNIDIVDNINPALDIKQDSSSYISIITTNGSEAVIIGNVTTNPDITFLGTGTISGLPLTEWTTAVGVVNLVTAINTVTIGSATAGGKLFIDSDANELQLQVDGFTTQTGAIARFEHFDPASVASALSLRLDAAAFTGRPRGLTVDFANAASIDNAADVYGIELKGRVNDDFSAATVGLYCDSGFEYAFKFDSSGLFLDNKETGWGTDYDAWCEWITAAESGHSEDLFHLQTLNGGLVLLDAKRLAASINDADAGEALAIGDVLAMSTDGKLYKCDADHATPARRRPMGIALTTAAGVDNNVVVGGLAGTVPPVNTDLSVATVGDRVYASAATAGGLTTTPPVTGEIWQVGLVVTAATVIGGARIQLRIQHILDN